MSRNTFRDRLQADGILTDNTLETLLNSIDSNPSEEEDDLASVEADDDFVPADHDLDSLFGDVVDDMNFLTGLLSRIYRLFYADELANEPDTRQDDKLQQLLKLLEKHSDKKLLIFTEFCDTARYLYKQLQYADFEDIEQIDSRRKVNREEVIERFFALL